MFIIQYTYTEWPAVDFNSPFSNINMKRGILKDKCRKCCVCCKSYCGCYTCRLLYALLVLKCVNHIAINSTLLSWMTIATLIYSSYILCWCLRWLHTHTYSKCICHNITFININLSTNDKRNDKYLFVPQQYQFHCVCSVRH